MFCELHTRSAFSFLSSGSQPQRLAQRAAELGIGAAALIDRDTVAGAVRFHFEAKANNVKPIIGSEITMENGSLLPLVPMTLKVHYFDGARPERSGRVRQGLTGAYNTTNEVPPP